MKLRDGVIKETCRLIREARKRWDAHENKSCRRERDRAMAAYEELTELEKKEIPEALLVWLRYRSEKYFGEGQNGNGMSTKPRTGKKEKKREKIPEHAVAYRKMMTPVGPLFLLSSKKGLCGVYFGHRIEVTELPKENPRDRFLSQAEKELESYFSSGRESFTVPLDARGSQFQRMVWRQLSEIPFGQTRSYGDLAEKMDNPKAVRAVGTANGSNPISIIVPCHRVIGKDGSMTGFGGGIEIKRKLLQHEGVLLKKI